MRALVADGSGGVELAEREPPAPTGDQALIEVVASSINRAEVRALAGAEAGAPAGGFDLAGTVAEPAADGSGPPRGARVVGYAGAGGAWAELAAVPTGSLASVPDGLDLAPAAVLPTAGLTALRGLRQDGPLLGRRVLVTGATGGVGQAALALARAGGATVTAAVRTAARAAAVEGLDRAIGTDFGDRRFDYVLDGVGGETLTAALAALAPGGTAVVYGRSAWDGAHEPSPAQVGSTWFATAMGARLVAFVVSDPRHGPIGPDLGTLVALAAAGTLCLPIAAEVEWGETTSALKAIRSEGAIGKVLLHFSK